MPLIQNTTYRGPLFLRNGHFSTVFTALFRKARDLKYCRETVDAPDGDFLDLDLSFPDPTEHPFNENSVTNGKGVVILLHGLEGSTDAHYIRAIAQQLNENGFSTVGVNFRGCSGRPNLKARSYHSGATEDLAVVVNWVEDRFPSLPIALVGFSLGGNVLLKYLGEGSRKVSVVGGAAVSVPCDLSGSAKKLSHRINRIYMRRFMKDLTQKLQQKNDTLGTQFDIDAVRKMKTFAEFDGAFTAPIHGYGTAENYWEKCSSLQFLENIEVPTLLINALDDPFLSESCFPYQVAENNPNFFLETPKHGGHVGFLDSVWTHDHCWHEDRVVAFLNEKVFG